MAGFSAWIWVSICWLAIPVLAQAILFGDVYKHFVNVTASPFNISERKLTVPPLIKWERPANMDHLLDNPRRKMKNGGANLTNVETTTTAESSTTLEVLTTPYNISVDVNDLLPDARTYRMYYDELADEVRNLSSQLYAELVKQEFAASCKVHSNYLLSAASHDDEQATKMIDAVAKLPSGTLTGNLFWSGSYAECVQSAVEMNTSYISIPSSNWPDNAFNRFTGQYCLAEVQRGGVLAAALAELSPPVTTFIIRDTKLMLGVCVPSSCVTYQVEMALKNIITARHDLGVSITKQNCQKGLYPPRSGHRFTIIVTFLTAWGFFVILGTVWDIIFRSCQLASPDHELESPDNSQNTEPPPSSWDKRLKSVREYVRRKYQYWKTKRARSIFLDFLMNFSLVSNIPRFLQKNTSSEYMAYLDGIRVINMGWIILGHVYSVAFPYMWDNLEYVSETRHNISFHVVVNGLYAVDTFFFVTGYLVTIRTLQKLEERDSTEGKVAQTSKENVKFVLRSYVGRYVRLTPNYALTIFLMSLLGPYVSYGPLWPAIDEAARNCGANWWKNLLYISNFISMDTMCQPHCWYLAVDMQIWLLAAILILLLHRRRTPGMWVISGTICVSLLITAVLTGIRKYPSSPVLHRGTLEVLNSYYQQVYVKPYCRLTPFFMGILAGNYLHTKQMGDGLKSLSYPNSRLVRWSCIIGAAAVCFAQGFFVHLPHDTPPKVLEAGPAVYGPLTKLMWGVVMFHFVIDLEVNKQSYLNRFLSARIFTPFLKLTYWAFLLHYGLLFIFFKSRQEPTQFDHWTVAHLFLGLTSLTYVTSLLCYLFFELPIQRSFSQLRRTTLPMAGLRSSSRPLDSNLSGIEDDTNDLGVVELPPTPSSALRDDDEEAAARARRKPDYASPSTSQETKGLLTVEIHEPPEIKETRVAPEGTSNPESPTNLQNGSENGTSSDDTLNPGSSVNLNSPSIARSPDSEAYHSAQGTERSRSPTTSHDSWATNNSHVSPVKNSQELPTDSML